MTKYLESNLYSIKFQISIITIVYFCTNMLMLFNNGVFWDDWTLYNMDTEGITELFKGNGLWNSGIGYIHIALQKLPYPSLIYRSITFILGLFSAILFFTILKRTKIVSDFGTTAITLFYIVLPFNAAKINMICLPYTICLAAFISALYFFILFLENRKIIYRLISLFLFFYSFTTNSLLMFYGIIPLILMYKEIPRTLNIFIKKVFHNFDFIVLPIVFWIFKTVYLVPSGEYLYQGYNTFNTWRLISYPKRLWSSFYNSLFGIFDEVTQNASFFLFIILIIIILLSKLKYPNTKNFNFPKINIHKHRHLIYIIIFILGATPYILVGKPPSFEGYSTRHQLLIAFSLSFIFYDLIITTFKNKYQFIIFLFTIISLFFANINIQLKYLTGWFKYESILKNFMFIENLEKGNTILVYDLASKYNPTSAPIVYYEWNGMAKLVDGYQNRLFIDKNRNNIEFFNGIDQYVERLKKNKMAEGLNMKDYKANGKCVSFIIEPTDKNISSLINLTKLTFMYYFANAEFEQYVTKFISIKIDDECQVGMKY